MTLCIEGIEGKDDEDFANFPPESYCRTHRESDRVTVATQSFDGNPDLSAWDVSSVTNFQSMFAGANNFIGDLSGWKTSSVCTHVGPPSCMQLAWCPLSSSLSLFLLVAIFWYNYTYANIRTHY